MPGKKVDKLQDCRLHILLSLAKMSRIILDTDYVASLPYIQVSMCSDPVVVSTYLSLIIQVS